MLISYVVSDVQANSLVDPTCFRIHIKCCKTDFFRVDCNIYVGRGNSIICPAVAMANFLALHGPSLGHCFFYADGHPLTHQLLSSAVESSLHLAGYPGTYSGHSF